MILPADLAPLPVRPRGEEAAGVSAVPFEDFVSLRDVQKVLLGGTDEMPVECLAAEDFESFAGRSDVGFPLVSRRTGDHDIPVAVPDLTIGQPVLHPAFEVLPSTVRRATPPRAPVAEDCEATYGRARMTDRWWVIGMGLAAAAILFSGAAVDFISREAVRRSHSAVEPVSRVLHPQPEIPGRAEENRPAAIAATGQPDKD